MFVMLRSCGWIPPFHSFIQYLCWLLGYRPYYPPVETSVSICSTVCFFIQNHSFKSGLSLLFRHQIYRHHHLHPVIWFSTDWNFILLRSKCTYPLSTLIFLLCVFESSSSTEHRRHRVITFLVVSSLSWVESEFSNQLIFFLSLSSSWTLCLSSLLFTNPTTGQREYTKISIVVIHSVTNSSSSSSAINLIILIQLNQSSTDLNSVYPISSYSYCNSDY